MPWREVRASSVKARQHLFWCSNITASAVTLHFGLFSNLQASIYSFLNIFLPQYISQYTSLQSNQFWLFSNPTNSFPIYFSSNKFPNISLPQYISQCAFAVSHTAFQIIFQPSRLNIFPNAFLQGGLRPNDLCVHKIFPHHSNLVPACFLSLFFSFLTQLTWSLSLLYWIPMCASSSHLYWGCMSRTRGVVLHKQWWFYYFKDSNSVQRIVLNLGWIQTFLWVVAMHFGLFSGWTDQLAVSWVNLQD